MAAVDEAAMLIGPGCDDRRDQSTVTVSVAQRVMTVMAMADAAGRIEEVVASAPHQGPSVSEQTCQAQAQQWAQGLSQHLGPGQAWLARQHGAARVSSLHFKRGAWLEARWFAGGGSCDLSLHYHVGVAAGTRHP